MNIHWLCCTDTPSPLKKGTEAAGESPMFNFSFRGSELHHWNNLCTQVQCQGQSQENFQQSQRAESCSTLCRLLSGLENFALEQITAAKLDSAHQTDSRAVCRPLNLKRFGYFAIAQKSSLQIWRNIRR